MTKNTLALVLCGGASVHALTSVVTPSDQDLHVPQVGSGEVAAAETLRQTDLTAIQQHEAENDRPADDSPEAMEAFNQRMRLRSGRRQADKAERILQRNFAEFDRQFEDYVNSIRQFREPATGAARDIPDLSTMDNEKLKHEVLTGRFISSSNSMWVVRRGNEDNQLEAYISDHKKPPVAIHVSAEGIVTFSTDWELKKGLSTQDSLVWQDLKQPRKTTTWKRWPVIGRPERGQANEAAREIYYVQRRWQSNEGYPLLGPDA